MPKNEARIALPVPKTKRAKTKIPGPLSQIRPGTWSPNAPLVSSNLTTAAGYTYPRFFKKIKLAKAAVFAGAITVLAASVASFSPWRLVWNRAGAATTVVYVNGYPTISGNFVDCNGNVDNDPSHHTTDPSDSDPAHHIGQNCPAGSLIAAAGIQTATAPALSAAVSGPSPAATVVSAPSAATAAQAPASVSVWWPVDGATVLGTQPFKAVVTGLPLNSYQMYWQVDGGALNLMDDNTQDSPHKEAQVNVSGWDWKGSGPYSVTFIAKNASDQTISSRSVNVYIPASQPASGAVTAATTVAASQTGPANGVSGNPLAGAVFYRDLNSNAQQWINMNGGSQPQNALLMQKIASQPNAVWLGGWNSNVASDAAGVISAAKAQGQMPIFVLYNIPNRDCGGYSAGGAQTASEYQDWINQVAAGIGNNKAAIVLEPDGTALTSCLSAADLQTRYQMLSYAVNALKALPGTAVYIDAGHPDWISAGDMAGRLQQSGIARADGFALNMSNFTWTSDNIAYGQQISSLVGGKHFVIDTSRNGQGPASDNAWCNPPGRGLGSQPTSNTGNPLVDALIWGKDPGGSDGACNGGPNAGVFWPDYALGLASLSSW